MQYRFAVVPNRGTYSGSDTVKVHAIFDDKSKAFERAKTLGDHRVIETVDRTRWYGWELDREPSVEPSVEA